MEKIKKKKCRNCKRLFIPDHRNRKRQKYCNREPCKKASKAVSQKKWLSKPENEDYFRGPDNVKRVQEWRRNNPDYGNRTKPSTALQDSLTTQPVENIAYSDKIDVEPLQDLLMAQPPVIIGLLSNLIGSVLQDDIANTLLRMQQSGQEIVFDKPKKRGGIDDCKRTDFKATSQENTKKLQLGRSPTG
ncbi:MAG: hypothetical protein PF690_00325 [Deltaproteobacteria bacterium]|jgi:hypothetical protein|nr:hypothetical protein [Deltaproteobacteria bacterium]